MRLTKPGAHQTRFTSSDRESGSGGVLQVGRTGSSSWGRARRRARGCCCSGATRRRTASTRSPSPRHMTGAGPGPSRCCKVRRTLQPRVGAMRMRHHVPPFGRTETRSLCSTCESTAITARRPPEPSQVAPDTPLSHSCRHRDRPRGVAWCLSRGVGVSDTALPDPTHSRPCLAGNVYSLWSGDYGADDRVNGYRSTWFAPRHGTGYAEFKVTRHGAVRSVNFVLRPAAGSVEINKNALVADVEGCGPAE